MSKVICDICGTEYPGSAKCCPLCGSSREYALEGTDGIAAEFSGEEAVVAAAPKRNREIFDYDEVNQEKPAPRDLDDDFDDEDEYEESRTNTGLVIILVILIVLLLLASGFFYVRYLLPNLTDTPEETEPVVTTAAVQTEPVETTDPTIPCSNLMMDGGKMELGKDGMKLLNVRVYPENTTDELVYISGDEAVVTVSDDGTVTAVGEGQTVITVQCGSQKITCNVTVDYAVSEETVPEGTIPAMQAEGTEETAAQEETQPQDDAAAETTEAVAEATTEATVPADAVLKLKKDDITISSNYTSVKLELEGDIDPEKLSWFTMDSTIAIVHGGVVTSTGSGMTRVYGEYDGQQVMCIVRCIF